MTDTAWNQGLLDHYEVGIYFEPSNVSLVKNGVLTFGGVNQDKISSVLHNVLVT